MFILIQYILHYLFVFCTKGKPHHQRIIITIINHNDITFDDDATVYDVYHKYDGGAVSYGISLLITYF